MLGNNRGYSLIEVMISVSLLAVVSFSVFGFCNRQQAAGIKNSAKNMAQKDVEQLINLVKRDHKLQIINGFHVAAGGIGVEIDRIQPGQSNPNLSYRVQFLSACIPFPANHQDYDRVYQQNFRQTLYAAPHSCIAKVNCAAGTYPGIQIKTQGSVTLNYQPGSYPVLGKSLESGPVGMVLCAEQQADQVKIWTETVLAIGRGAAYVPEVFTKFNSLPLKSASDLVLVPN